MNKPPFQTWKIFAIRCFPRVCGKTNAPLSIFMRDHREHIIKIRVLVYVCVFVLYTFRSAKLEDNICMELLACKKEKENLWHCEIS